MENHENVLKSNEIPGPLSNLDFACGPSLTGLSVSKF